MEAPTRKKIRVEEFLKKKENQKSTERNHKKKIDQEKLFTVLPILMTRL
jgi:hypothetical protein